MANGHKHHEHPALKFFVGNEELEVHTKTLMVREILDIAGCKPASDYCLIRVKQDGQGEEKYQEP